MARNTILGKSNGAEQLYQESLLVECSSCKYLPFISRITYWQIQDSTERPHWRDNEGSTWFANEIEMSASSERNWRILTWSQMKSTLGVNCWPYLWPHLRTPENFQLQRPRSTRVLKLAGTQVWIGVGDLVETTAETTAKTRVETQALRFKPLLHLGQVTIWASGGKVWWKTGVVWVYQHHSGWNKSSEDQESLWGPHWATTRKLAATTAPSTMGYRRSC